MSIKVIIPGPLSSIQDFGRLGYQDIGFPVSGAADKNAARIANILVGNNESEAVIEMTIIGMTVQFMANTVISITGANMSPHLNGNLIENYKAIAVKENDYLSFKHVENGCRGYIACSGGFGIPKVMGSYSTGLKYKIGGYKGRKLETGDIIPLKKSIDILPNMENRLLKPPAYKNEVILDAILGPQDDYFSSRMIETFFNSNYKVTSESDRMGLRLEGEKITSEKGVDIISDGIALGSVQIPASGQPIILFVDRQTTGGYAKIATVTGYSIEEAGQLMSGNIIKFNKVTVEYAQKEYIRREKEFIKLSKKINNKIY